MESVRLDKWLWAVRIFKTRQDAAEACQGGKVILNQNAAKPASKVRIGDALTVSTHLGRRMVKVIALTDRRVGAALVPDYLIDETPAAEIEAARQLRQERRSIGAQTAIRPTKKDRRDRERFEGGEL